MTMESTAVESKANFAHLIAPNQQQQADTLESQHVHEKQISDEKAINEEYKIWKKNSPFLYE